MTFHFVRAALMAGLLTLLTVPSGLAQSRSCVDEPSLRSDAGGAATKLTFRNAGAERRRIYWLDLTGRRKFYGAVDPGKVLEQPTFVGHIWVVTSEAETCVEVVTASTAPLQVELGGGPGGSTSAASPPRGTVQQIPTQSPPQSQPRPAPAMTSPVQTYGLSGWYQIRSMGADGAVNSTDRGGAELAAVRPDWDSAFWQVEEVPGTPFIRFRNKWKGEYMLVDKDRLRVGPAPAFDERSHWIFEGASRAPTGQIMHRQSGLYLSAASGGLTLLPLPDGGSLSQWAFQPPGPLAPRATPVPAAPVFVAPKRRPECGPHDVYNDSRGRCITRASTCSSREVYSSSQRQCVPIAGTCSSGEVYNDNQRACVPRPKPQVQPPPVRPPLKCGPNFALKNGQCVLLQNCGPNAYRSAEGDCYCNKNYQMVGGKCIWKTDKQGFEKEPWKKPGCTIWQAQCKAGSKSACSRYESTCQVN